MNHLFNTYFKAAQIGLVAGMRSMMAPALVSRHYAATPPTHLSGSPLAFVQAPRTARIFTVLAGGELIGDKLPNTPNRTEPAGVIGRAGSGAFCGAAIAQAEGQPVRWGALAGGAGALVGTFAFFQLRRWLTQEKGLPDLVVALAEDALSVGGGLWILNGQ